MLDVDALYREHYANTVRIIGRFAPPGEAEDAAQLAFIDLVRQQDRLSAEGNIAGWLATAAWRHAIKLYRKRNCQKWSGGTVGELPAVLPAPESVERTVEARLQLQSVRKLPPRARQAMVGALVGLNRPELARATGQSTAQANTARQHGQRLLRKEWATPAPTR